MNPPADLRCSNCMKMLPAEHFSVYRSIKRGRSYACKQCQQERRIRIRRERSDDPIARDKVCSKCKESKPSDGFYINKLNRSGLSAWCRSCMREFGGKGEWVKANKERHLLYSRNYKREYMRKRRNEDSVFRIVSAMRSRLYSILRKRALGKNCSTMDLVGCSVDFLRSYLESKFVTGMTWEKYGKYGWHVDHVVPLSSFDLADMEQRRVAFHFTNLQPLWASDNLRKGARVA